MSEPIGPPDSDAGWAERLTREVRGLRWPHDLTWPHGRPQPTFTPHPAAIPAPGRPSQEETPVSFAFAGAIDRGFAEAVRDAARIAPVIEAIAANPAVDQLVDAALLAVGVPGAEPLFDAFTAGLRNHVTQAKAAAAASAPPDSTPPQDDTGASPAMVPAEPVNVPQPPAPAGM